jgi:hypothetical protein
LARLPGTIEPFDLENDPEGRLLAYPRQQKPSGWRKAKVDFLGVQGESDVMTREGQRQERDERRTDVT